LSAETNHLLQKRFRQALRPLEILFTAFVATAVFTVVYYLLAFQIRAQSNAAAWIAGPFFFLVLTVAATAIAGVQLKMRRPSRTLIATALGMWAGVGLGTALGDRNWYKHMALYNEYEAMAQYVNVDPGVEKGQSYMDAGIAYFKESTYVLSRKYLSFRNGRNYCVAPIVRQPVSFQIGALNLETKSHFVLSQSGSIDFWAVGKDCCGDNDIDQLEFTCGHASSPIARSGLRLLDNKEREIYLLAVQQWAATVGLPVRHPIFFTWVKDPVDQLQAYKDQAYNKFCLWFIIFLFASFLGSFMVHLILQSVFKIS